MRGMGLGLVMNTKVDKVWLLEKLKANRARHHEIYEEALKGYVERAKKELAKRLELLQAGKVMHLHMSLSAPEDHTRDYDTVIGMLEANVEDVITLASGEFRCFVEDEWEWMESWVTSNMAYSQSATKVATEKGWLSD